MPCYHPHIIYVQQVPGQDKAKILKYINSYNPTFPGYEFYDEQNEIEKKIGSFNEYLKVPCGDCIGCQERYSKEWAVRCMLEAQAYEQSYFITLTYNDEHLPCESQLVDKTTGEIFEDPGDWVQTGHLVPEHLTKFFKQLRRHWEYHYNHTGIRFFACGEYGGQGRPHYHAVIFNLPINPKKLKVYRINTDGSTLYTCPEIEKIWGKGFITIAAVNWDTCAYTARYVMKKMKGKISREEYFSNGQVPEFIRMSRKPGIASDYFNNHAKALFENDEIIIKGHKEKIQAVKPPSYFDKKYDIINHGRIVQLKKKRKTIANNQLKSKMAQTSKTIKEQLLTDERAKKEAWKTLKRNQV